MDNIIYNINRPWETLDDWQKEYVFNKFLKDNFLLTGRQCGKTTAMSLRAVELCLNHFKEGDFVLINSITEKQAYHMLLKSIIYAKEKYYDQIIWKGKDKPTKHKLMFKNGTGILCYAAGDTGEGQRGFTIKKLMIDEGSRMSEEYFIAVMPMLSVIDGTYDISSTPYGKRNKDGSEKYFYTCSKDEELKKYFISSEDCPRHTKEFLEKQKRKMTKLAYAQEYLAQFTDELKRIFDDEMLKKICTLKTPNKIIIIGKNYLGSDVAGFGKDECTYEGVEKIGQRIYQRLHLIEKRNYTTDTTKRIIILDKGYDFTKIGVDDGGVGFGVFSELMQYSKTKRKTIALNNASRETQRDGKKSKRILKEEMYMNLLMLMEQGRILLLDNDEVINSLSSIQHDEGKIFGAYSHIAEGLIRAVWLAEKDKTLNIYVF